MTFCLFILTISGAMAARFAFDASCIPVAGDADWVVDAPMPTNADRGGQSMPERFPSPDACTIGGDTQEDYWNGGYSAWGIELVKLGHWVETIPRNEVLTYGDCDNTMDLSFYDVLVIPEPQLRYTDDEAIAIRQFVEDGGGLFLVGNHCGSDRNHNGYDATRVFEEMETELYFGIYFDRDPDGEMHDFCDWDELNNRNFGDDPNDPFIHGPLGDVGAIGFHSATTLILHPENNSSVKAHAWRNDQAHENTNVTVASVLYGEGRVAAIGDSAPADDGTGDPRDFLFNGWSHSTTNNDILHLNMSQWVAGIDLPPLPTRTPCPNHTPWPSCEGTATPGAPTFTPTPPATPNQDPMLNIYTNQSFYYGGDLFQLDLDIENPGPSVGVNLYIALQVADLFFWAPDWTEEIDYTMKFLSGDSATTENILSFTWPENAGRLDNIMFWAAMLNPADNTLVGNYDYTAFSAY